MRAYSSVLGSLLEIGAPRIIGKRMRPLTWRKPHQGKQEMARRVRQIENGQLTKSNGLVC